MPRVVGVDIPGKKRLIIALTYVQGVGSAVSGEVCKKLGFDPDSHAEKLTPDEIARLNALLQEEYVVEGDLRRQRQNAVKRLISINCYRGQRHRSGLPVRGQKTQKNARTRKGKKKTVAGKKK